MGFFLLYRQWFLFSLAELIKMVALLFFPLLNIRYFLISCCFFHFKEKKSSVRILSTFVCYPDSRMLNRSFSMHLKNRQKEGPGSSSLFKKYTRTHWHSHSIRLFYLMNFVCRTAWTFQWSKRAAFILS